MMIDWYRLLHPIRARREMAEADAYMAGLLDGMPTRVHTTATTTRGVVCKVMTVGSPLGELHLRLRVGEVEYEFDDEEAATLGDGLEDASRAKWESLPLAVRRARAEAAGDILVEDK